MRQSGYLQRRAEEKAAYNAVLSQMHLEVAIIAANKVLNLGPTRVLAFEKAFRETLRDVTDMTVLDGKTDKQLWYTKAKLDERLKQIYGENFQPWYKTPTLTPPNEPLTIELKDKLCYVGVDLSTSRDMTAFARRFPPQPGLVTADWLLGQVLYDIQAMPTLTPPNEPLTLEELREMDGEPVYLVVPKYGISEWNVLNGMDEIVLAYDEPVVGMKAVVLGIKFINGRVFGVGSYGEDWLAYRRPPEGEEDTRCPNG